MPTTSPLHAALLLDALVDTGIPFAILHGEAKILDGTVSSDIDVVVGRPPSEVARQLAATSDAHGLHLVAASDYDVGALCTFWCTADAAHGVQLDLWNDPHGHGRFGIRTQALLEARISGAAWPTLDCVDQLLYLLRKRHWKRDWARLPELRAAAGMLGTPTILARAETVLTRPARRTVSRLLRGDTPRRLGTHLAHWPLTAMRYARRTLRPAGFWAELHGSGHAPVLAEAVAERFRRFLVHAVATTRPQSPTERRRPALDTVPVLRRRPALIVSTPPARHLGRPDARICLRDDDLARTCRCLVAAMTSRTRERPASTGWLAT